MMSIDEIRLSVSRAIPDELKSELGQYMTPSATANFMASLFSQRNIRQLRLLDPGAGIGALSVAFLDKLARSDNHPETVSTTVCEIDSTMRKELAGVLSRYVGYRTDINIESGDFIETAVNWLQFDTERRFTHVIMNPPYKKISRSSRHRKLLRNVGIETVNLYSAFVALALKLLSWGGELVAIIPRSFCNGPYYKAFRDIILSHSAIRHIHLFESRGKAFKDDHVLQENIIIKLERSAVQSEVVVSYSSDDKFNDYTQKAWPFSQIVHKIDPERFIHIPTSEDQNRITNVKEICHTLGDIGLEVSTGPVVEFRVKEFLRKAPEPNTVPLLYPSHFSHDGNVWPIHNHKRPNAIVNNDTTLKWLYPIGYYCVVKRFSSKEEKRRITASVVNPELFGSAKAIGFENHINVFHEAKSPIQKTLAYGLAAFLNTTVVDQYFRMFNGHTQVNATDLRKLRYPSREVLEELGKWVLSQGSFSQDKLDAKIGELK